MSTEALLALSHRLRHVKLGADVEIRWVPMRKDIALWLAKDLRTELGPAWKLVEHDHPEFVNTGNDDPYTTKWLLYSEDSELRVGERTVCLQKDHPIGAERDFLDMVRLLVRALRRTGLIERVEQVFFGYLLTLPSSICAECIDIDGRVGEYRFWDLVSEYATTVEKDGYIYRIDLVWDRGGGFDNSMSARENASGVEQLARFAVHGAELFGQDDGWRSIMDCLPGLAARCRDVLIGFCRSDLRNRVAELLKLAE